MARKKLPRKKKVIGRRSNSDTAENVSMQGQPVIKKGRGPTQYYIALNNQSDSYRKGTRPQILGGIREWLEDDMTDMSDIEVYPIGERIKVTVQVKLDLPKIQKVEPTVPDVAPVAVPGDTDVMSPFEDTPVHTAEANAEESDG